MQGDIKSQPLDGVVQHNCACADIGRRRRARSRRAPEIGVDQNLLLREINGQHVLVVIKPRNVKDQHGLLSVADRVPLRDGFYRQRTGSGGREWELRKPVGTESARLRRQHHIFDERPVALLRHDDCAFGRISAHPAQMIEMVVAVDQVADGLARNDPLGFRDYGAGERIILGEFVIQG